MTDATWLESLKEERAGREALYLSEETPLGPEARAAFRGMRWFPPDPRFRLRLPLERYPRPRPGDLGSTGGDAIGMLEVGAFSFTLNGVACRLLAYEPAPGEADEAYMLIPFRDATSGDTTYGGGRYLDVEPVGDAYEVDFNRAYHPYCAHDESWSCTIPPLANTLPVAIEAGERL